MNEPVSASIVTRDVAKLVDDTHNIYESIFVIGRRARQIAVTHKEDITNKLSEFASGVDNLEEVFENREQIEVSRNFERMPKPSTMAIEEFSQGKVYHRVAEEEESMDGQAAAV
jgi:DNA-directed RNA polymerase subunit K/omega